MEDDKFIFKSKGNPFQLSGEISTFALNQIAIATHFLMSFMGSIKFNVTDKRTYHINTPSGLIKVASFKTDFIKNNKEKCTVEISNPYEFIGSRYWTHFANRGAFWTNKNLLIEKNINPDIVFNLLAKNHEWIYRKVENLYLRKHKGEEIDIKNKSLINIDYSPNIDFSPRIISNLEKEKVAFEVFENIFTKK
jgi:hypothetical protein